MIVRTTDEITRHRPRHHQRGRKLAQQTHRARRRRRRILVPRDHHSRGIGQRVPLRQPHRGGWLIEGDGILTDLDSGEVYQLRPGTIVPVERARATPGGTCHHDAHVVRVQPSGHRTRGTRRERCLPARHPRRGRARRLVDLHNGQGPVELLDRALTVAADRADQPTRSITTVGSSIGERRPRPVPGDVATRW